MDQGVHYFEAYHSDSRHHSWTGIRLRLPEKPDHCKWVDKVTLHSLPVLKNPPCPEGPSANAFQVKQVRPGNTASQVMFSPSLISTYQIWIQVI